MGKENWLPPQKAFLMSKISDYINAKAEPHPGLDEFLKLVQAVFLANWDFSTIHFSDPLVYQADTPEKLAANLADALTRVSLVTSLSSFSY